MDAIEAIGSDILSMGDVPQSRLQALRESPEPSKADQGAVFTNRTRFSGVAVFCHFCEGTCRLHLSCKISHSMPHPVGQFPHQSL